MRKILLCIPSLAIGGAEKFVVDLALNLDKRLFAVTVAITRRNVTSAFLKSLTEQKIPVVDLSGNNYLQMLKAQVEYLKREKPDVVHTNIGSLLHMLLATWIMRTPMKLYTVHNQATLLYGTNKLRKLVFQLAFRFFGYTPIAICDNVKTSLQKEMKLQESKIKCVNNGVDLQKYFFQKKVNEANNLEIITTGRLCAVKNHEMLVRAVDDVYSRHKNIRLTILGDGEKRQDLDALIKERKLEGVIRMPGVQKNVCSYLQKADIYVSSSITEGLPLSILEAMACGLPVVATDAGGTVDIVKKGENGIIVPKNDLSAMVAALEQMITDAELRAVYGNGSLKLARAWSIENCVKGYEKLYLGSSE